METKSNRPTQDSNTVLVIPYEVNEVLNYLAKENKLEWQCFAEVEELVGHKFRISNLVFPKQKNTGASTETTEEEYAEAVEDMDEQKGFCWIHSHNTMGTFWSTTDYEQMDRQRTTNGSHTFSLVVNAKGDRKAALNMHRPVTDNFDMEVEVEPPVINQNLLRAIEQKILEDEEGIIDSINIGININNVKVNEDFLEKHQEELDAVQRFVQPAQTSIYNSQTGFKSNSQYNWEKDDYSVPMTDEEVMDVYAGERIVATPGIIAALKTEMKRVFDKHGYDVEPDDVTCLVEAYETKFDKKHDTIYGFVLNYIRKAYNV